MSIICKDAGFGYEGICVINGLNFTVESGDYLCIVGKNGGGKSTLIKGLLGLIKPQHGTITFTDEFKKSSAGYLAQQSLAKKDFPAGVFETVISGFTGSMGLRPFYTASEKQKALDNLSSLGVADLKDSCFSLLSGGQQRRVLIARALCATQTLLVLDEPAAGLDPESTSELYSLLQKINTEMHITLIMVSHNIEAVKKYASKILHLQNNQCFFGCSNEYKSEND
ncbi:MAG: metal ABC transporter ATP-binding protein [Termitinemataceae bacterium]|nr:MAG: metal ABC transporter ATP-binding protein [Termitinemataceae bacterium]